MMNNVMLKGYIGLQNARNMLADKARALGEDRSGATMIEYSVLIALITAGLVATIILVGDKVAKAWTDLDAALPGATP